MVAVGRTGGVTGSLTIDGGALVAAEINVDMTTIVSNDSRREGAIRGAVGASSHPTATFVLVAPVPLPEGLADGEVVSVEAAGDLTVNGVTSPVMFTIDALVRDDGLGVVTGSAEIVFADFDVTAPSAPIVVSVDDEGIVEFQLIVAKGRSRRRAASTAAQRSRPRISRYRPIRAVVLASCIDDTGVGAESSPAIVTASALPNSTPH